MKIVLSLASLWGFAAGYSFILLQKSVKLLWKNSLDERYKYPDQLCTFSKTYLW